MVFFFWKIKQVHARGLFVYVARLGRRLGAAPGLVEIFRRPPRVQFGRVWYKRNIFRKIKTRFFIFIHFVIFIRLYILVDFFLKKTGHSLGAGTASVLSVLLKPTYPTLRCFAYAPPLCFDQALATETQAYITTIVYHDDLVARLSLSTLRQLKDQMKFTFKYSQNQVPERSEVIRGFFSCVLLLKRASLWRVCF